MKKYIIIFFALIILCIGMFGFLNTKNSNVTPKEGVYFMKSNSYLGFYPQDPPLIQLPLIIIHKKTDGSEAPNYKKYMLISDKGTFTATLTGYNPGPKDDFYSLYTMNLILPELEAQKYTVTTIKVIDLNDQEHNFKIGEWVLDVILGQKTEDVQIGKATTLTIGNLDNYTVELTNKTSSQIDINNLDFKIPNEQYTVTLQASSDFNVSNLDMDLFIKPNKTKTFIFNFKKISDSEKYEFITLKPFITYKLNGLSKKTTLPTLISSPNIDSTSIGEIIKFVEN